MAGPRRNVRRADTREAGDTRARANTIDSCNIRAGGALEHLPLQRMLDRGQCLRLRQFYRPGCQTVSRVGGARGRARRAKKAKRPEFWRGVLNARANACGPIIPPRENSAASPTATDAATSAAPSP